jgi:diguanylate cyclase (GGDEF)-like protein
MGSLKVFLTATIGITVSVALVFTLWFGYRFSNQAGNFYLKNFKDITYLFGKNVQYMSEIYNNRTVVRQVLQNIKERLKEAKAVYLRIGDIEMVYPGRYSKTIFFPCVERLGSAVITTSEGILVCYPLHEELATSYLGKGRREGTFAMLFVSSAYDEIRRLWLLKLVFSFLLIWGLVSAGLWGMVKLLNSDVEKIKKFVSIIERFLTRAEFLERNKSSLESLKKRIGQFTFSEFKILGNLLVNLAFEISTLRERLEREAIEDPLTGLYNRNFLRKFAGSLVSLAKRERIPFTVAVIDIDDFKKINDTYGHAKGDEVLRTLGKIIRNRLRTSDAPVRMGGEEILLMFFNANKKEASSVVEEIKERLSEVDFGFGKRVTFSAGVAGFPEDFGQSVTLEELVELADERLYKAKRSGKNRVVWM